MRICFRSGIVVRPLGCEKVHAAVSLCFVHLTSMRRDGIRFILGKLLCIQTRDGERHSFVKRKG